MYDPQINWRSGLTLATVIGCFSSSALQRTGKDFGGNYRNLVTLPPKHRLQECTLHVPNPRGRHSPAASEISVAMMNILQQMAAFLQCTRFKSPSPRFKASD